MNTVATTFKRAGMMGVFDLLSVNPNIPAEHALATASDLLSTIVEPIEAAAMGEKALEHDGAWLVAHTLETAKALVDAVTEGLREGTPPATSGVMLESMSNLKLDELTESEFRNVNVAVRTLGMQLREHMAARNEAKNTGQA